MVMDGDCVGARPRGGRGAGTLLRRARRARPLPAWPTPAEDAADAVLRAFAAHAGVPVISLESAVEHPCQGLADQMTLVEKLGVRAASGSC